MTASTIAFCRSCKWRSSTQPVNYQVAGAKCPSCGSMVSAVHFDPTYSAVDQFGRDYVEMSAMQAVLAEAGITTTEPTNVPLP
jgi:hypothetical protein